mgnify:CR=1 FL=1|tara:strand:+ start:572 stop:1012 length:441 start_codon:yes stop_codon:yes gene_type:complete
MKTYNEWARDSLVTSHDYSSFRDYVQEELVAERRRIGDYREKTEELRVDVDKAFGLEDRRHRNLVGGAEKSRRRINQLERETAYLDQVLGDMKPPGLIGGDDSDTFVGPTVAERLDELSDVLTDLIHSVVDLETRSFWRRLFPRRS